MTARVDFASADHYAVLGVSRNANEAEITQAYKGLARRYHPDKNPSSKADAEVSFKRVAEAYTVLRDATKRREYDASGSTSSRSYVSYEEAEAMWRSYGGVVEEAPEATGGLLRDADLRRKAVGLIVVLVTLLAVPRLFIKLLPGLTAALVGVAVFSRREQASRWAWCVVVLLLAGYAAPWVVKMRSNLAAKQPLLGGGQQEGGQAAVPVGVPHSGEEVLMSDGSFLRIADPAKRALSGKAALTVEAGWQQRLLGSMTSSIRSGQEQVVMVFSREGCPWCDRQIPVLQRAIARRAGGEVGPAEGEEDEPEGAAAFLLPGAGRAAVGVGGPAPPPLSGESLLFAPLRIFVFDAGEFPYFAQTFRIEAFPTTIAWGPPGVTPMAAQGYLDDQNFDQLLRTVALAKPPPPGGEKKRKGLFR